jgi:hypothetical protein
VGYDSELNFPCSGAGFFYNLIAPLRGDWVPGLTSAFADFAKDADVSTIVGPIHPSLLVPRGLRESHDRLVFDGMPSNSPDLLNTLFSNGWTVERRLHELLWRRTEIPDHAALLRPKLMQRLRHISFAVLDGKEIAQHSQPIASLYNAEWSGRWGFSPLLASDITSYVDRYSPDYTVAVVAKDAERLVGVCVASSDSFHATQSLKARAFLLGVDAEYRNRGLAPILVGSMCSEVIYRSPITDVSIGWMLDSNEGILSLMTKSLSGINTSSRSYAIVAPPFEPT